MIYALIFAVLVLIGGAKLAHRLHHLVSSDSFLVFAWLWFTGHRLEHREHRRYRSLRHRARHAGLRNGTVLLVVVTAWAWMAHRGDLEISLACAMAVFLGTVACMARPGARRLIHHHRYVTPLHARLENVIGVPVAGRPREWLKISPDNKKTMVMLPPSFDASDQKLCEQLEATVSTSLALESPEVTWKRNARDPHVIFTPSTPPPATVTLAQAGDAIDRCPDDRLVLALGKKNTILDFSLHSDSPHIGMSIGSGHGKSVTARLLAAQVLARNGLVVILDGVKRTSHPWARGLQNVIYADSVFTMHSALEWLGGEMGRRNDVAVTTMDVEGNTTAVAGARILIIFEEMNSSIRELRKWWATSRDPKEDPKESPALAAWAGLACMGRSANMNIAAVAQMLTVAATGGVPEIRENMSVRILGRYSANNWKMLCPEHAMPPKNSHPGLVQVITSEVREGQVVKLTGQEARDMSLNGTALFPHTLPRALQPVVLGQAPAQAIDAPAGTVGQDDGPALMSLRQVLDAGLAGDLSMGAVRKRLQRAANPPGMKGKDGSENLYDAFELRDWLARELERNAS